jgi:glycerol-3-phosphate dehydrogenase
MDNLWERLHRELRKPEEAEVEIVSLLKGADEETRERMLEVIRDEWGSEMLARIEFSLGRRGGWEL